MTILISIIHVLVSLFLILVVLAQQGKGQDLASAFGGGGSQTAFGARGTATLLSKITAGAAALFMITSLTLSYLRPAVSGNTVIPDAPAAVTESSDDVDTESTPAVETPAGEPSEVPSEGGPEAGAEEVPPPQPPGEPQG